MLLFLFFERTEILFNYHVVIDVATTAANITVLF